MTCADLVSVLDNTSLSEYFHAQVAEKKVDYNLIVKWLQNITDDITNDIELQRNISRNILNMLNDPSFTYDYDSFILTQYTSNIIHKEEMSTRVFDLPSIHKNVLNVFITECTKNITSGKRISSGLLKNCELFLKRTEDVSWKSENNTSLIPYTETLALCIRLYNNKETKSSCVIL